MSYHLWCFNMANRSVSVYSLFVYTFDVRVNLF